MEGNAAMKKKCYKGYLLTGMKMCGRLFLLYVPTTSSWSKHLLSNIDGPTIFWSKQKLACTIKTVSYIY